MVIKANSFTAEILFTAESLFSLETLRSCDNRSTGTGVAMHSTS
eukprot:SAG11_NODE_10071_length_858_cov_1.682477_1_plen_43_part_10